MKLFGYLTKPDSQPEKERPPFIQQVKEYIEQVRLKISKKDRSFKVALIILAVLFVYLTGVLASILRYFGEIPTVGFRNSPKPTAWPWGAVAALFSIKYSFTAFLILLLVVVVIMGWWIRNHIGLGKYDLEERGGLKFKKQTADATLGSAREMTPEEMVEAFTVTPVDKFTGKNNPGKILFGRDRENGDFVTEKEDRKRRPNRNTLTVGAAGSFKSTNYIIPMVMQLSRAGENMIINDSSSEISKATYHLLKARGYNVKIFNISNPKVSDGWNFVKAAGKDPMLAKAFAQIIIDGAQGKGEAGETFWIEGMYVLLSALILYVNTTDNCTIEEIRHLLTMDIDAYPALFQQLPIDHPARLDFNTFWQSPVRMNNKSGTAQRLAIFNSESISRICSSDGIDILEDLATEGKKTAIFIVTSSMQSTFSFVPSLFLTASAVQLHDYAENFTDELTLPTTVHYIMDEFANTGRIEDIGRYLSTSRKDGLVFHLIIQSFPQFYKRYDENEVGEIISNCKHILVFGINEPTTAEFFEKYCGPTTARTGMTASSSVVLKNTDQYREGEQQRSLFYINEFITMDEYEYLLLTIGKHPLVLRKVFWEELEDSRYVEDFKMREYVPQSAIYRTPSYLTETQPSEQTVNEPVARDYANVPDAVMITDTFRDGRGQKKKAATRKGKNKQETFDETPPLLQANYYADRPVVNADEVITEADKNTHEMVCHFLDNKMDNGNPRVAVLLRYEINGLTCHVGGTVPDNRYMAAKTKIDLHSIEQQCKLTKEGCVLIGWRLTYRRKEKRIETKRLKADGGKYVNENGEIVKSYSFSLPQSDCNLSPIFIAGKGTSTNNSQPVQNPITIATDLKL